MNGLATVEFQDNQPIMHKYNYYKYNLWVLNYLHTVIVTCKRFYIRNYFPTAKKSVENEGIQGKYVLVGSTRFRI